MTRRGLYTTFVKDFLLVEGPSPVTWMAAQLADEDRPDMVRLKPWKGRVDGLLVDEPVMGWDFLTFYGEGHSPGWEKVEYPKRCSFRVSEFGNIVRFNC